MLFLNHGFKKKDIQIYLNSPGGSVYAGLGIYDTMQYINCDVATICTGMAALWGAVCHGGSRKTYSFKACPCNDTSTYGGAQGQTQTLKLQPVKFKKLKKKNYTTLLLTTVVKDWRYSVER